MKVLKYFYNIEYLYVTDVKYCIRFALLDLLSFLFRHEDRDKALHLCSSYFDKDTNSLTKHLEQLEKNQAYTRAAAIAVFNLKLKLAIDILSRSADLSPSSTNLNIVAMALAGFSDDKNSMWRHFCSSPKAKLSDPYLRAMFAFLTAENYNYNYILVSLSIFNL